MKTLDKTELQLRQEEIATRALHRWEETGHHHHRELEVWLEAEAKLGAALPSERVRETLGEAEPKHSSVPCVEDVLAPAW
jgi:hypothetical protein